MGNKCFYTVPFVWSRRLWVMTFGFFILWAGGSAWLLYCIFTQEGAGMLESLIALNILMLPTMLICEGYAPQRLEIGHDHITILRRYKSVTIYANEVHSVERLPDNAMRWAIRTGGVGGLFGFYGNYRTHAIGSFTLYATQFDNLFLITLLNGKKIVISCSEPEKMQEFQN